VLKQKADGPIIRERILAAARGLAAFPETIGKQYAILLRALVWRMFARSGWGK